jgi:ABC-2 type transport system permease protein
LTNRELKKWYKAPVIFILSIIQPIIWMGLLGKSMNIGALFSGSSLIPPSFISSITSSLQQYGMPPANIPSFLANLGNLFSGLGTSVIENTFGTSDYFSFS